MKNHGVVCVRVLLVVGFFTAAAPASGEPINVLSLQEGACAVVVPPTYGNWNAENLLDDSPQTGWACESGHTTDNVFVFELIGTTTLERFEFDNASVDAEGAGAKDILVEVSTTSPQEGFTPALEVTLADKTDQQSFPDRKSVM